MKKDSMDALERFNNPAKYLVEKKGSAIWHVVDKYTIRYKSVSKEDAVLTFSSDRDKQYEIIIEKTGEISALTWPEIMKMHQALLAESKYHKIKRAVISIPKPAFIRLNYDDERKSLCIIDNSDRIVYELHENGSATIMRHETHDSVKEYFHTLVLKMLYA